MPGMPAPMVLLRPLVHHAHEAAADPVDLAARQAQRGLGELVGGVPLAGEVGEVRPPLLRAHGLGEAAGARALERRPTFRRAQGLLELG